MSVDRNGIRRLPEKPTAVEAVKEWLIDDAESAAPVPAEQTRKRRKRPPRKPPWMSAVDFKALLELKAKL